MRFFICCLYILRYFNNFIVERVRFLVFDVVWHRDFYFKRDKPTLALWFWNPIDWVSLGCSLGNIIGLVLEGLGIADGMHSMVLTPQQWASARKHHPVPIYFNSWIKIHHHNIRTRIIKRFQIKLPTYWHRRCRTFKQDISKSENKRIKCIKWKKYPVTVSSGLSRNLEHIWI